jgi:hypothetical protein
MAPRISVRRKGDNIFLTIEGAFNCDSFQELLSVVRQLLMTSLKCATPGSQLTYCLKTRGEVDFDKLAHFNQLITDKPCHLDVCGDGRTMQEHEVVPLQKKSPHRQPRNGLILVKGGAN